ncbi:MAG: recombinase family protein, partial [Gammaproteobacteria bacterium]|nr:recombinase family protein [Gammaproteobacteria bacterium]
MKIGYARVSTDEQNLDLQIDALKGAGCEKIFTDDGVSGITIERDGLSQAILGIGQGDVLV